MYTHTMSPSKLSLLKSQAQIANKHGFFLAGGSALALHLGHRTSRDLDWFSNTIADESSLLRDLLAHKHKAHRTSAQTIHAVYNQIESSFIAKPGIGHSTNKFVVDNVEISIASVEQIATMKILALCNRGYRRDFIDIYAIVKSGMLSMEQILHRTQRFGIPPNQVARTLKYFADAERQKQPIGCRYSWSEVRLYFESL